MGREGFVGQQDRPALKFDLAQKYLLQSRVHPLRLYPLSAISR
jgi:hypothetical protein